MKEQKRIPVTKLERTGKFISTGAKIGTNYLRHYGKKLINGQADRSELHEDNAKDIYQSLSQLKGSALKVAQMLSMDKNMLPTAYQQQFAMAQYSAPPLSYPLVVNTFRKYFGTGPEKLFDSFSQKATNAASMGQVHQAMLNGKRLAVKVQYPGVADTVKSDLAMVKPIALKMFKLNEADYNEFVTEVEGRLLEEADYSLELERSIQLSGECRELKDLVFPKYYSELSSPRVLTMDWIEGKPLGEFLKAEAWTPEQANQMGQAMWDFYHFQIHELRTLHADPHPGNFIVTPEAKLGVIDFGCVKVIPSTFYDTYFQLLDRSILEDEPRLKQVFHQLNFVYDDDKPGDYAFFQRTFSRLVDLLGRPFSSTSFDFSDPSYFAEVYAFGKEISESPAFRASKRARGVKDALYINRTYFGLYNLLHELKATVCTNQWRPKFEVRQDAA